MQHLLEREKNKKKRMDGKYDEQMSLYRNWFNK